MEKNDIPPEELYDDKIWGWHYSDEGDFIRVLTILRKHIELYLIPEMNKNSTLKKEVTVTAKNYLYLKENLTEIIEQYRHEWQLDGKSEKELLAILSENIEQCKNRPFLEIEKQLANVAAVYGDFIIRTFKGYWAFSEFSNSIGVNCIASKLVYALPLWYVINVWKGEGTLEEDLNRIKTEIPIKSNVPNAEKRMKEKVIYFEG